MIKHIIASFLLVSGSIFTIETLREDLCVTYGSQRAPVQIVEYYSLACPNCIQTFNEDFPSIKKDFINTGKVYWTLHPTPMDLTTMQAMVCCDYLEDSEKKLFLEELFLSAEDLDPDMLTIFMGEAMKMLNKSSVPLDDLECLKEERAFKDAFEFLKQEDVVEAVPALQVNGGRVQNEVPTYAFVKKLVSRRMG